MWGLHLMHLKPCACMPLVPGSPPIHLGLIGGASLIALPLYAEVAPIYPGSAWA